ncbi:transcriptional regulator [Sphingomonas ginkgonis]|uniref:Transcriptional regulator n=1 Tax=Sphingomonas ginkgonis TaxID=2315330 RepID=A0A3R9YJH1_9SPHN|nr:helix-turn-helix transcriptional regulator [Sphingomonas ginkgonis]RST31333.1 transcriptional regulator [Sphingomonas ginkgonis]
MAELIVHVRQFRVAAGLTQQELADRVGVSRKTINALESGIYVPLTTLALRLSATLGRPVQDMFELSTRDPQKN